MPLNFHEKAKYTLDEVKKCLAWEWRQKYSHKFGFSSFSFLIPPFDPVTTYTKSVLTGDAFKPVAASGLKNPPKTGTLADYNFSADIEFYVLDGLRTYVLEGPGSNGFNAIFQNTDDYKRGLFENYSRDNGDAKFWQLVVSVSMDDHHANLPLCRQTLSVLAANNHPLIAWAQREFSIGNETAAMFCLMYGYNQDSNICEFYRATYAEKKADFIALVNTY